MSAVTHALKSLRFTIPEEILKITFKNKYAGWRTVSNAPTSLDEQIMTKVVRPRVMVECDLIGGQLVELLLSEIPFERTDNNGMLYFIPPEKLNHRPIISIHSISLVPIGIYTMQDSGFGSAIPMPSSALTTVTSIGNRIADSYSNTPITHNTSAEVTGPFSIVLRNQITVNSTYRATLVVANDKHLNNISPRSWLNFAKLVELAVKSYIFNTMRVRIDEGVLEGGVDLGYIKEYIETLSDAEENYQTYLRENWAVTAFCNDQLQYEKFIKCQLSPNF